MIEAKEILSLLHLYALVFLFNIHKLDSLTIKKATPENQDRFKKSQRNNPYCDLLQIFCKISFLPLKIKMS